MTQNNNFNDRNQSIENPGRILKICCLFIYISYCQSFNLLMVSQNILIFEQKPSLKKLKQKLQRNKTRIIQENKILPMKIKKIEEGICLKECISFDCKKIMETINLLRKKSRLIVDDSLPLEAIEFFCNESKKYLSLTINFRALVKGSQHLEATRYEIRWHIKNRWVENYVMVHSLYYELFRSSRSCISPFEVITIRYGIDSVEFSENQLLKDLMSAADVGYINGYVIFMHQYIGTSCEVYHHDFPLKKAKNASRKKQQFFLSIINNFTHIISEGLLNICAHVLSKTNSTRDKKVLATCIYLQFKTKQEFLDQIIGLYYKLHVSLGELSEYWYQNIVLIYEHKRLVELNKYFNEEITRLTESDDNVFLQLPSKHFYESFSVEVQLSLMDILIFINPIFLVLNEWIRLRLKYDHPSLFKRFLLLKLLKIVYKAIIYEAYKEYTEGGRQKPFSVSINKSSYRFLIALLFDCKYDDFKPHNHFLTYIRIIGLTKDEMVDYYKAKNGKYSRTQMKRPQTKLELFLLQKRLEGFCTRVLKNESTLVDISLIMNKVETEKNGLQTDQDYTDESIMEKFDRIFTEYTKAVCKHIDLVFDLNLN